MKALLFWIKSIFNPCLRGKHVPQAWDLVVDRFMSQQFDPSGIHEIHSHYRPDAMWPVYWNLAKANFTLGSVLHKMANKTDEREKPSWSCKCKRCDATIWTFFPTTLDGREWGSRDQYRDILNTLNFERSFYGIDPWRAE